MVNSIGGIDVNNPRAFSDAYLKPNGFKPGAIHLGGYDAMAFARIRKTLAGGDFDRSANQQRVLRGIQAKIRAAADQPGFIERGVLTVMANMHTNLPPSELFRLAQAVAQVEPAKISDLRRAGRDRQHRRRQRGAPVGQPGPPATATTPARTPRSSTAEPHRTGG